MQKRQILFFGGGRRGGGIISHKIIPSYTNMMKMSYLWDPSDVFKNVLLSQKRECEIHFMPRTRELAAEEMKISRVTIELLIVPCDGLNRVVARICSVTISPTINSHGLIGLNGSINNAHPGKRDCS